MALELVLNTVVPLAEGARLVLYCGTNLLSTEKQNIIHFQFQIGHYIPIVWESAIVICTTCRESTIVTRATCRSFRFVVIAETKLALYPSFFPFCVSSAPPPNVSRFVVAPRGLSALSLT
jgi:hypothetical protein